MKIQILSDLHLEFHRDGGVEFIDSLPNDCDVLVMAGDIDVVGIVGTLRRFCKRFRSVVYVAGNHEFYGRSVLETLHVLGEARAEFKNFHWIENDVAIIDGVTFVGATLWFGIPSNDRFKDGMNDFGAIRDFEPWVYGRNETSRRFLQGEISSKDVVVTHHLPSPMSVSRRFQSSPLNEFFVSDLTQMILDRQPQLWIHGHTHDSCDYRIGKTRVVCNPYGYAGHDVNARFDPGLTIEV